MRRREFLPALAAAPAFAQPSGFQRLPEIPAAPPAPAAGPRAQRRWRVQWMFDEDRRSAALADFCCPAPGRAIAVLRIEGEFRDQNAAVLTRDGGRAWSMIPLRDAPLALCAAGESGLWLLGAKSLWYSAENGLEWTKKNLPKRPGNRPVYRIHFLDDSRGWAFGAGRTFYQTSDGGATWRPVPESSTIGLKDENTAWTWMAFLDPRHGLIAGFSAPRRDEGPWPDWMAPERARQRRLQPTTTIAGETRDGGQTWKFSFTSAFGRVVRLRAAGSHGLAISHYGENFDFPGEVYLLDFRSGSSRPIFRRRDLRVDDGALLPDGSALLAAIQPPGALRQTPIPGRLRIFHSPDLQQWNELKVDYRAEGGAAFLAAPSPDELWAATDTGCILRLV
ncbi:MAG: hypothetical protein NZR01_03980 [Bryobacteraceae bacterium]|nr:hypothetical protein [Bryobacteraceae bacterium]